MPARGRRPGPPQASAAGLRAAVLRLLGRRDYTTAELGDRLRARGFEPSEVERTLRDLTGEGLVDDRRVAGAHVRLASQVKNRGRRRIERELTARGLDPVVVHEALAALPAEEDEAAIRRILARKQLPQRLSPADHRRLYAQLLRRGFGAETIARTLRSRED